jgi:transposase
MRRSAMAELRRTYTREFKPEAVRRIAAEGWSLAEVALELALDESLLRCWKTALAAEGEQAFPGKGHLPAVEVELHRSGP